MKKIVQIFLIILLGALPSLAAIYYLKLSTVKFIGSEFLLGYLGIFLGFAFSIVTFIISLVDKARTKIESDNSYTETERQETKVRIGEFTDEVSDTMKFLFFSFLFVVIIMILEVWDIPNISISPAFIYTKVNILNAIKFSIFGFSVYGIYDLLIGTFSLNARVENILRRKAPTQDETKTGK